jgi:hypothetical protein
MSKIFSRATRICWICAVEVHAYIEDLFAFRFSAEDLRTVVARALGTDI